ncbi:MAG: 2-oxoglutarate dehydrogenase complex dihydrolipoyllysine-residue succinyltransferase [Candidatus Puniceispirillaceae bacterium]
MSTEIKVPVLGESVVEATVSQWMKAKGDAVQADEPIVELETDKVTLEVPSPVAGVLEDIVAAEGSTVGVDALLAVVAEGKAAAAQPASAPAKDTSTPAPAAPATPAPATPAPAAPSAPATGAAMTLSPAVRKLVEEHQLNPAAIRATGKDGRLTKADVKAAIDNGGARNAAAPASAAPVSAPAVARPDDPREERVPMSRLRRIIASRLKDAQNTAAMLTTFNEVDMSAVMALRSEYKDEFEKNHGARLGFMGFFVKAVITALTEFPAVNAEIHGDDIIYKNFYNIGVAVGTPQGLVVPVLKDAQHMGLADIESTIGEFGQKARDGKLGPADMAGGTFTISNGGVYGSLMSTPILNPPQSGILGMHKIQKRPVAIGNSVEIRPMMYLALSYDHRIIDGREAVSFLVRVKESIEDPRRLLLGV